MRDFQEIRGQCIRLDLRPGARQVRLKTEPHRFAVRKPDSEVDAKHMVTAMARSR